MFHKFLEANVWPFPWNEESIFKISILRRACKNPSLKIELPILSIVFCLYMETIHSCFIRSQNLHVFHQISSIGDLLLPKVDQIFGVKLVFDYA